MTWEKLLELLQKVQANSPDLLKAKVQVLDDGYPFVSLIHDVEDGALSLVQSYETED